MTNHRCALFALTRIKCQNDQGILCNFSTWDCWGLHVKQWPVDGAQSSPKMYVLTPTFRPTFLGSFYFWASWQGDVTSSDSDPLLHLQMRKYFFILTANSNSSHIDRCVTLWTPIKVCLMTNYRSAQSKITLFLTFRFSLFKVAQYNFFFSTEWCCQGGVPDLMVLLASGTVPLCV